MDKILVVDDEPGIRALLKDVLSAQEYDVICASRAGEALEVAALERPDLVITDVGLPDGDGVQVARGIREIPSDIPVLIMTGAPSAGGAAEAMNLGIYDYLWKPLDLAELSAAVERALSVRRLRRELSAVYLGLERFDDLKEDIERVLLRGLDAPAFQIGLDLSPLCGRIARALSNLGGDAATALQARLERVAASAVRLERVRGDELAIGVGGPASERRSV